MSHFERRWYHWHPSSVLTLVLLVLTFAVLAVPATVTTRRGELATSSTSRVLYFGWPFVHRVEYRAGEEPSDIRSLTPAETLNDELARLTVNSSRSLVRATHASSPEAYWSNLDHWRYTTNNDVGVFLWQGLAANIAIAASVCLIVPLWIERRRRKKEFRGQLGLFDTCLKVAIAVVIIGVPIYHLIRWQNDATTVQQLADGGAATDGLPVVASPNYDQRPIVFVHRLTDYGLARWSAPELIQRLGRHQLSSVTLFGSPTASAPGTDPIEIATTLGGLPALRRIEAKSLTEHSATILKNIPTDNITELSIERANETVSLKFLSRFDNLRTLALSNVEFTPETLDGVTFANLEEIELDFLHANEAACTWMEQQPNLKIVYLRSPYPVDEVDQRIPNAHITIIPHR